MDEDREAAIRRLKRIAQRAAEEARMPVPPARAPAPPRPFIEVDDERQDEGRLEGRET
jgi:hypothetical protein